MRYVMALLRRATFLALSQQCEHLDHTLLADAYRTRLARIWSGSPNPFESPEPQLPRRTPKPPHGRRGRRSSRRSVPVETLADVRR